MPPTEAEAIRLGRTGDRLLEVLDYHPGILPAAATEAREVARKRAHQFADMLLELRAAAPGSSMAARAEAHCAQQRASGEEEALLDLPAPSQLPTARAFADDVADRFRMPPRVREYEYVPRDTFVTQVLADGHYALPEPDDAERGGGPERVSVGVRRSYWDPPAGVVNGRGGPAWRLKLNSVGEEEPVEGLARASRAAS